jgi:hypothetical protein
LFFTLPTRLCLLKNLSAIIYSMHLLDQARSYVLDILRKCEAYPYHNPSHTIGVYNRATYIALAEGIE